MALTDNLIVYYNCDETSGTTVHDSANGHDGTLQGSNTSLNGRLICPSTANVDGGFVINNHAAVTALDMTQYPLSISGWFKTSFSGAQSNQTMKLFSCEYNASPWDQYSITMNMGSSGSGNGGPNGTMYGNYRSGAGSSDYYANTTTTYNDGNWHFAVLTISSSGAMKLYIDASVGATATATGTLSTGKIATVGNVNLGSTDTTPNSCWIGEQKLIGVWDRELTSAEVMSLYNSGSGLTYSQLSGSPVAPTVTTGTVTSITDTAATVPGNVTSDGGATISERGVVISTSANPTTADTKFTVSGTTGAYNASLTGLTASTTYHARAYAINSVGTSYGSDVSFTTSASGGSSITSITLGLSGGTWSITSQS